MRYGATVVVSAISAVCSIHFWFEIRQRLSDPVALPDMRRILLSVHVIIVVDFEHHHPGEKEYPTHRKN